MLQGHLWVLIPPSSAVGVPQRQLRLTGDGGLGNSQLIAREALKLSKRAGNTMGSSAEKQPLQKPTLTCQLGWTEISQAFLLPSPKGSAHY